MEAKQAYQQLLDERETRSRSGGAGGGTSSGYGSARGSAGSSSSSGGGYGAYGGSSYQQRRPNVPPEESYSFSECPVPVSGLPCLPATRTGCAQTLQLPAPLAHSLTARAPMQALQPGYYGPPCPLTFASLPLSPSALLLQATCCVTLTKSCPTSLPGGRRAAAAAAAAAPEREPRVQQGQQLGWPSRCGMSCLRSEKSL